MKLPRGPSEPGLTWHEGQGLTKATGVGLGGGAVTLKERIDFPVRESTQ